MSTALSWVWVAQVAALIVVGALSLTGLLLVWQRQRPLRIEVTTHEVNRSWEEIKREIEARNPKVEWQYSQEVQERLKQ